MFVPKQTVLFPLSHCRNCVLTILFFSKEMQNSFLCEYRMMHVWLPTPGAEVTSKDHSWEAHRIIDCCPWVSPSWKHTGKKSGKEPKSSLSYTLHISFITPRRAHWVKSADFLPEWLCVFTVTKTVSFFPRIFTHLKQGEDVHQWSEKVFLALNDCRPIPNLH